MGYNGVITQFTHHLLTSWDIQVGGGFKYVSCLPLLVPGEMIQFDEHIFQMGWFNHLVEDVANSLSNVLFREYNSDSIQYINFGGFVWLPTC